MVGRYYWVNMPHVDLVSLYTSSCLASTLQNRRGPLDDEELDDVATLSDSYSGYVHQLCLVDLLLANSKSPTFTLIHCFHPIYCTNRNAQSLSVKPSVTGFISARSLLYFADHHSDSSPDGRPHGAGHSADLQKFSSPWNTI